MLTPIDIQNHSLKTAVRGYSKKETDDLLEEIIKSYEELYRENRELKDKLSSLSDGIQYYKGMESTLQKALVLAEKTSSETQEAAKSKAEAVTSEAETKAEAMVKEAKAKAESIEAEANAYAEVEKAKAKQELEETRNHVRKLVQSYENYRLQFKKLAESQIEMLDSEHYSIFAPELEEMLGDAPNADEAMEAEETVAINAGISSKEDTEDLEDLSQAEIARAEDESTATDSCETDRKKKEASPEEEVSGEDGDSIESSVSTGEEIASDDTMRTVEPQRDFEEKDEVDSEQESMTEPIVEEQASEKKDGEDSPFEFIETE